MGIRLDLRTGRVAKRLVNLHLKGTSYNQIASILHTEFGIEKPSTKSIRNALKDVKTEITKYDIVDKELKEEMRSEILNTTNQLKKINKIINDIIDDPKTDTNVKIKATDKILNQLEFQRKTFEMFLGKDSEAISYKEITKTIVETLTNLERDGFIKIIKPLPMGLKPKIIDVEIEK